MCACVFCTFLRFLASLPWPHLILTPSALADPNLVSLYDTIGVKYAAESYAGSFSRLGGGGDFFSYSNALVGGLSIPYLWRLPLSIVSLRILRDLVYFLVTSRRHVRQRRFDGMTFREYLEDRRYSSDFVRRMIVPTMAGICTCSYDAVLEYPAQVVLHYHVTRSMRGVRRIRNGARDVVSRLAARCAEVRLGAAVEEVRAAAGAGSAGGVEVRTAGDAPRVFDHVVLATQANQAAGLLRKVDGGGAFGKHAAALAGVLARFRYERSELVLHTDERLMPANRRMWRAVNFVTNEDDSNAMASIWMNYAQPTMGQRRAVFQTWNPILAPRADSVLCRATFERPVVTLETERNTEELQSMQGRHGLWVCGSYALLGVPLLETGVSSAVEVAEAIGASCPWRERCSDEERAAGRPRAHSATRRTTASAAAARPAAAAGSAAGKALVAAAFAAAGALLAWQRKQ